ncbi:MAG TPA: HEAT repeat domain-containing protein [Ktedonobacteraceae bacterium]|nr:HEAT repeat domain-containing protein [Ktedonobacteraceae bacterium]
MPRGRKRPPQESVDSILLAMSRREDLDDDTLSRYLDLLDEEWLRGAREKVLHLLRTNDISAHSAAVLILSELATEDDLEDMEDFVADPTVTDLAKLTLAPILKDLGSEMADDGILLYLNDPEAAMQQMQMRLLELVGQSELGVESILEDVLEMPLERRLAFIGWLGSSHDPRAANLLVPLLENSSTKVAEASIEALEELGTIAAHQAIPALNYLIGNSSNRAVKQRARAALGRLTMQSVPGIENEALQAKRLQRLPLYESRVSFIDGVGSQMIMLSWRRPDGLLKGVNMLYQDQWGIKDCYGTDEMDADHWSSLVGQMDEQGFGSFLVPVEYARALIAEARVVNKRTRHRLPIAFAIWRPFIEDEEPLPKGALAQPTAVEPVAFSPEVERLAQRGDTLYDMAEFSSWLFEPFESLQPYINRYWTNFALSELSLDEQGTRGRGRKRGRGKTMPKEQVQYLEDIISEALADLADEPWRSIYEARLRRQAMLFKFSHRERDLELVRAVATAVHPASGMAPTEQPFLRNMMRLSIQQGPIRLLAEALETGQLGNVPLGLFPIEEE